jgi:CRISPR-associated protein Csd2
LELLWQAILGMFEHDHSAARGNMAVRELIVFQHDCELGVAPAHKLFSAISVSRKEGVDTPRAYSDYEVSVSAELPEGITCTRMA